MSIRLRPEIVVGDREGVPKEIAELSIEDLLQWVHWHGQNVPFFYIRLVATLLNRKDDFEEWVIAQGGEEEILKRSQIP